jgi:hypothetical protein
MSSLPRPHYRQSSPRLPKLNQQFTSQSRQSSSTKYALIAALQHQQLLPYFVEKVLLL